MIEALGIASKFNAFFFGDFSGVSSDVQGRLAAKGTINISGGYQNGAFIYDPVAHKTQTHYKCNEDVMKSDIKYSIIGGSIIYNGDGEILNGGVAYQNTLEMTGYIHDAIKRDECPIDKKSVIDFDREKENLISISKKLDNMTKSKKEIQWGKIIIELDPSQKLYVYDLEDFSQFNDIEIKENGVNPEDVTIVFNIKDSNITFTNYDISRINKFAPRIIWNAPNANKVIIQNFRIQGSFLAPNADIEGYNGNIQGQMIGKSFKGNLQIDWVPFYGCI